jgi:hypothetical protein
MQFIKYYSHEIYTVITLLLISLSAIFVTPDSAQKLALAYALLFLLHEWEENNYPGSFFKMLFGEIIRLEPVPSGAKLKESRIYLYTMLIVLTFTPYFLHMHIWLLLPIVYLAIFEGFSHSLIMPKVFKLNRNYTPGMVTALIMSVMGIFTLFYIIQGYQIEIWQYIAAFPILIAGLAFMAIGGMRSNGINPREIPKRIKKNIQELRNR